MPLLYHKDPLAQSPFPTRRLHQSSIVKVGGTDVDSPLRATKPLHELPPRKRLEGGSSRQHPPDSPRGQGGVADSASYAKPGQTARPRRRTAAIAAADASQDPQPPALGKEEELGCDRWAARVDFGGLFRVIHFFAEKTGRCNKIQR